MRLSTPKPSDPGGGAASANAGRSRSLRITGAGSPIGGASLSRSQGTPHSGRRPQCSPVPVVRQVQLALPVLPTPRHSAVSSERETGAAESSPPPLKASQPLETNPNMCSTLAGCGRTPAGAQRRPRRTSGQVWLGVGGGRIGSTVSTSLLSVPRGRLDEGVGAAPGGPVFWGCHSAKSTRPERLTGRIERPPGLGTSRGPPSVAQRGRYCITPCRS